MDVHHSHDTFDAQDFLQTRYGTMTPGTPENFVRNFVQENLVEVYRTVPPNGEAGLGCLSVLDYGCGPAIANVISAAGVASEIVLAEYAESNRKAIQQWLDHDPSAFDWSPYFKYVVQTLEGKDEQEVIKREERLRSIIKAVVPCDINKDEPIENGYEGPYDIVSSLGAIESAIKSHDEYSSAIKKHVALIKPGGYLLIWSCHHLGSGGHYNVGGQAFHLLKNVSPEFIVSNLEQNGLVDIVVKEQDVSKGKLPSMHGKAVGFHFVRAMKPKVYIIFFCNKQCKSPLIQIPGPGACYSYRLTNDVIDAFGNGRRIRS